MSSLDRALRYVISGQSSEVCHLWTELGNQETPQASCLAPDL